MIASVIFSNDTFTFWDVMLLFFVFVPLLMLWFFCMFDVFRRADLGAFAKVLWLVAIIVLPWIGSLLYLILRPRVEGAEAFAPSATFEGSAYDLQSGQSDPSGQVPTGIAQRE